MRYHRIRKAVFLSRPNRFIAQVALDGEELTVHVKNTGRCRELLLPGAAVYLEGAENPARKTAYDLVAVEKKTAAGSRLINMDAQAPNHVFKEWAEGGGFRPGLSLLRSETTWGNSRFDFYWEGGGRRGFVEVKGVTLEKEGGVYFPDAPTLRGVKHLRELVKCREEGYEAAVCFVIQMEGAAFFSPNDVTHPEFGEALREAACRGVEVLAVDCAVTPQSLEIKRRVEIRL